jgi:hypothetical protein
MSGDMVTGLRLAGCCVIVDESVPGRRRHQLTGDGQVSSISSHVTSPLLVVGIARF